MITKRIKMTVVIFLFMQVEGKPLDSGLRPQIAQKCSDKSQIDPGTKSDAAAGIIPGNPAYKDFLACSYKEQGYLTDNGDILIDKIKEFLKQDYSDASLSKLEPCGTKNGGTNPDIAFNALTCIVEKLMNSEIISN